MDHMADSIAIFTIHSKSFSALLEDSNLALRVAVVVVIVMEEEYFINKALHRKPTIAQSSRIQRSSPTSFFSILTGVLRVLESSQFGHD